MYSPTNHDGTWRLNTVTEDDEDDDDDDDDDDW